MKQRNNDYRIVCPVNHDSTRKSGSLPSAAKRFPAVPLLDLKRQYATIREEVLTAIERVCASQQFILGQEVEALEHEITAFTGAAAAVGCASGTDALWLALLAAGVRVGNAVVTTAFSFFASSSAIVRAGARPVFVDIDPVTFNIDPVKVEAKLRNRSSTGVRAILPVHLYGQCANMTTIGQIAEEFSLAVVEDAAQAIGAAWRNQRAGSLAPVATFSFYPTKNLSAYGDAGLVTTIDPQYAEHMQRLRNHGCAERYVHEEIGCNARLDEIQAAILRVKLPHVEKWNGLRRQRAATYGQLFSQAGLTAADSPLQLPQSSLHAHHVFHQYVIRAHKRDALRSFLAERKIGTEVYYPIPLHLQPCFSYLGYEPGDLPESERAAQEVVALPMFPELTEEEQKWVVDSVAEFYS